MFLTPFLPLDHVRSVSQGLMEEIGKRFGFSSRQIKQAVELAWQNKPCFGKYHELGEELARMEKEGITGLVWQEGRIM